jgi:hypothetical protein
MVPVMTIAAGGDALRKLLPKLRLRRGRFQLADICFLGLVPVVPNQILHFIFAEVAKPTTIREFLLNNGQIPASLSG